MPRRTRNLAIAAGAPLIAIFIVWKLLTPHPPSDPSSVPPVPEASSSPTTPSPESAVHSEGPRQRLYSIGLYRLKGLSPATPPGASLEIWVSWSPKASGEPKLQRLIQRATLEGIEPALVPEAPSIATLRLSVKDLPQIIWAELFGELAVAALPH